MVNKLKLNFDKTRSMLIHPAKNSLWKNLNLYVKIDKKLLKRQIVINTSEQLYKKI